jgi:ergothioneine biosynthesis protein EgtB
MTTSWTPARPVKNLDDFGARLFSTRRRSLDLSTPLSAEDQTVQPNEDASPTKWHLAHSTWFFETFVLRPFAAGYRVFDDRYNYCFNSYYEAEGARQPRAKRGLLTRPGCAEILAYRRHVDAALQALLADKDSEIDDVARRIEIGVNHEQQHQELLLTDILCLFAQNPLRPAYRAGVGQPAPGKPRPLTWTTFDGGIFDIGFLGPSFSFDNETPRHKALLQPFKLADRLVANADWLEFMRDGGYRNPALWLADGWSMASREGWTAPLYWEPHDGHYLQMTLGGLQSLDPAAPVCHVSYYEAEAFARWAGARLPTEFEWEAAVTSTPQSHEIIWSEALGPRPATLDGLCQMFGEAWQWTQSAYLPYPGYRAAAGALGEYNGKFMCGQMVLRGSSCVTPEGHARSTYRNFFYPHQRWQFSGLRLANEA